MWVLTIVMGQHILLTAITSKSKTIYSNFKTFTVFAAYVDAHQNEMNAPTEQQSAWTLGIHIQPFSH